MARKKPSASNKPATRAKPAAKAKPTATKSTSPPPAEPRRCRGCGVLTFFAFLLTWAALAAGTYYYEHIRPDQTAAYESRITALEERLNMLSDNVTSLNQEVTPPEALPPSLAGSSTTLEVVKQIPSQELAVLEERLTALEAQSPDLSSLEEKLLTTLRSDLEEKTRSLSTQPSTDSQAIPQITAWLHLRERVHAGAPYNAELSLFKNTLPEASSLHDTLAPLAPHADSGLPSHQQLKTRFPSVIHAVLHPAGTSEKESTTWNRITQQLSRVITIRKLDAEGATPEALLTRAEHALEKEQLGEALGALNQLPTPLPDAADSWRAEATTRHNALQALESLYTALSQHTAEDE